MGVTALSVSLPLFFVFHYTYMYYSFDIDNYWRESSCIHSFVQMDKITLGLLAWRLACRRFTGIRLHDRVTNFIGEILKSFNLSVNKVIAIMAQISLNPSNSLTFTWKTTSFTVIKFFWILKNYITNWKIVHSSFSYTYTPASETSRIKLWEYGGSRL